MGIFGNKDKDAAREKRRSLAIDELMEVRGNAKGLTAKEMRDLKKLTEGKTKPLGDIRAGLSDLKNGRKGGGVGPPPEQRGGKKGKGGAAGSAPEQRKGRSMWS